MADRVTIHPIRLGGVNCYLVAGDAGFVLIDTGYAVRKRALVRALETAGCRPDGLALVVMTHGDTDHTGNSAYLRRAYGAPLAMHEGDAAVVRTGDMRAGRKEQLDRFALPFRVVSALAPKSRFESFQPDRFLHDGERLDAYGFPATVYHTPGHSAGSISILSDAGDLFCGDLLARVGKPGLHFLISDLPEAKASVDRLLAMDVKVIYPGHGRPFPVEELAGRIG